MRRPIGIATDSILIISSRPLHARITKEEVEAVIESYKKMNWWP